MEAGQHVLILGGSLDHLGGVEAFCDRASDALARRGNGWRLSRIPTSSAYLRLRRLPAFLSGLWALVRYSRQRPDCVWLQYVNLPDLAYLLLAKSLGFKVMVTPHLGSNWRSQSIPALRALSGRLLKLADRLALISPTQELEINLPVSVPRSSIRNFLPSDLLVSSLPDLASAPRELRLIHSGRLSEGKGSFLVVDICAGLRDRGVPFRAAITGGADASVYAALEKAIARYGLQDLIALPGRVPEDELHERLRQSDILVHPSKIDSYPLIVLEAIACGMQPVCMDLAGARNMIEIYGGHVVSQDGAVDETVAWLAVQHLDEVRRSGVGAAARVREDYSWDRCAAMLEAALEAVVSGGVSPYPRQERARR